ncbi:DUF2914 domain-containing protein [Pseudoalteromonas sp. MMG010]|uniref:DUF2914 domain-containing protein n=1 Tax=Pseudoalteromonas sp. MMG010 TaxID=2822685 RepID=UPI001B3A3440|nr:DUF2914 domain-containing protein [Pseudoalteromonas sp. MMG010]MBQ4834103.1 DUF2914 domain-containing protein [Pseudoalteromonas sp. MMG010]
MNQKIVIKANVIKEATLNSKAVSYQWHWHRIISVIMFVLMTSAAVFYGLSMSVSAEQSPQVEALTLNNIEPVSSRGTELVVLDDTTLVEKPEQDDIELVELSYDTPDAALMVGEVATQKTTHVEPATLNDEPTLELSEPEIAQVTAQVAPSQEEVQEQKQESAPAEDASNTETASDLFSGTAHIASVALGAKIDTNKVSRAVLTRSVSNREPTNVFSADIRLKQFDDSLSFFSELKNMQGQKIKHLWQYEGNVVAEIPLNITTPRYRTFSKKHIMASQLGHWRVDVIDEMGNLIAQKEFRILAD